MPAPKLEGPIAGTPFAMLGAFDLSASGYLGEEWFVSGEAGSFALAPGSEQRDDGRWSVREETSAPFRTRILVRKPADPARFSGTVVVEWLNVSGGIDAAPDWLFLHRHLMREGSAWIGVSVQRAGIAGGGLTPGLPLVQADAARYGSLAHPGDAFAYDIFTQIGRVLRDGAVLSGLDVRRVIAIGESQSAGFLVSYVNAIDPLARAFDAFLIHGRGGIAAGIDGVYVRAPSDGDLAKIALDMAGAHRIREDVRVPVLNLQSETDVVALGGGHARQPDSARFRLWEVAGAAHFDTYGLLAAHADDGTLDVADLAERMAPTDRPMGLPAKAPINAGPQQHYVLQAAFAHLERQVRDGTPPPRAPRLETTSDRAGLQLELDALGIARGGVRSPWVDAPACVLSGLGQGSEGFMFMFLFGITRPFDEPQLARLYPGGPDEHLERFLAATDSALAAGFLHEADVDEIRALGRHGRAPSGFRIR